MRRSSLPVVSLWFASLAPAVAQCGIAFNALLPANGVDGEVIAAATWDVDGAGPLSPEVVVAGNFTRAGGLQSPGIARWRTSSGVWSTMSPPSGAAITAMVTLPNGDLAVAAGGVHLWNGTWTTTSGAPAATALAVAGNGDLLAVAGASVHRRSAGVWQSIGAPAGASLLRTIVGMPNGDIMVAGFFQVGSISFGSVARFDGTSWSVIGPGINSGDEFRCMLVRPNGDLWVGGRFFDAGGLGINRIARWNGSSWSALPSFSAASAATVLAMSNLPNGAAVVVGALPFADHAQVFQNGAWSSLGVPVPPSQPNQVNAVVALPDGGVVIGGNFTTVGAATVGNLALARAGSWSPLWSGVAGDVDAAVLLGDGRLVVTGEFSSLFGVAASRIGIRGTDGSWTGLPALDGRGLAVAAGAAGEFYVGGSFVTAGTQVGNGIARWDGAGWQPLGTGLASFGAPGVVRALLPLPGGEVIVGGSFQSAGGAPAQNVARWNGSAWSALGPGLGGAVRALARLPDGTIVAGGDFNSLAGQFVSRWNGSSWQPYGTPPSGAVRALVVDGADLILGGSFSGPGPQPNYSLGRSSAGAWIPFGPAGAASTIVRLPDASLLVGGAFQLPAGSAGLLRVQGQSASVVAAGSVEVRALVLQASGQLFVGGAFGSIGSVVSSGLVRAAPVCAANAVVVGAGCTGSGGPNVLASLALPWIGATSVARASGMPATGIAAFVRGVASADVLLSSLLPQAGAGCRLRVDPLLLDAVVPAAGVAVGQLVLPNDIALIGQSFCEQVVALELDPQANLLTVTATNALSLTIGSF
ncbi:MAG: hypothetical protein MUC36_18525 [Planctomycetes bacterium]|jgi:hypothetical protein|nr:hypothetical protein [Planctomycetota bacterium]